MDEAPPLRFLADESCDFAVVRALRAEGYDVLAVSEVTRRSDDRELIYQAYREKRVLLTEDKDFGAFVVVQPGHVRIRRSPTSEQNSEIESA